MDTQVQEQARTVSLLPKLPAINRTEEELRNNPNNYPRYVTPAEWERAMKLEVSDKTFCRKTGKKKERHRITALIPQFTGVTGTDIQSIQDDNGDDKQVIFCIPRVNVEKFLLVETAVETDGGLKKKIKSRQPLSSWYMDALKFVEEFEAFAEEE